MKHFLPSSFMAAILLLVSCATEFDVKPDDSGLFIKYLGGIGNDAGTAVIVEADGYVLTGSFVTSSDRRSKMYLAKIDLAGNLVWQNTLSETGTDGNELTSFGKSLHVTSDGYLLAGEIMDEQGLSKAYIVNTNKQGNKTQSTSFALPFNGNSNLATSGYSAIRANNGDLLVMGTFENAGLSQIFITRLFTDLTTSWTRTYGVANVDNDAGFSIIETNDGGFVWCGSAPQVEGAPSDMRVVKINADGQILWSRYYGGTGNDTGVEIRKHPIGFAIIGSSQTGGAAPDIFLQIIDNQGNPITSKLYGGSAADFGLGLDVNDAGIIITGSTQSEGQGLEDIFILKTDLFGNTLWENPRVIGGTGRDVGNGAAHTPDGGAIVIGTLTFEDDPTICLIRMDREGKIVQ